MEMVESLVCRCRQERNVRARAPMLGPRSIQVQNGQGRLIPQGVTAFGMPFGSLNVRNQALADAQTDNPNYDALRWNT